MANKIYQSLREYGPGDRLQLIRTSEAHWFNVKIMDNDREFKQITIEDETEPTNEKIINYHEILTLNNLNKQTNGKI